MKKNSNKSTLTVKLSFFKVGENPNNLFFFFLTDLYTLKKTFKTYSIIKTVFLYQSLVSVVYRLH